MFRQFVSAQVLWKYTSNRMINLLFGSNTSLKLMGSRITWNKFIKFDGMYRFLSIYSKCPFGSCSYSRINNPYFSIELKWLVYPLVRNNFFPLIYWIGYAI
jgi:hypothetical protein